MGKEDCVKHRPARRQFDEDFNYPELSKDHKKSLIELLSCYFRSPSRLQRSWQERRLRKSILAVLEDFKDFDPRYFSIARYLPLSSKISHLAKGMFRNVNLRTYALDYLGPQLNPNELASIFMNVFICQRPDRMLFHKTKDMIDRRLDGWI